MSSASFDLETPRATGTSLSEKAEEFCTTAPYKQAAYGKRNWGGPLHSLCSYQGKLKPSIAHFLVSWFTEPGQTVLDPLAGVGTIPLEARIQGRVGLASDLSPLADTVCRAKLEPFDEASVWAGLGELGEFISSHRPSWTDIPDRDFGLNGPLRNYFHEDTFREIAVSREFFLSGAMNDRPVVRDVLCSSLLHILHGNRPYALSRRSHPVTPFAPSGPTVYRPVVGALEDRLRRILPVLMELGRTSHPGRSWLADFRSLDEIVEPVDAVITSPPFSKSFRFWSSNWMRLWFAGWSPQDFKAQPAKFLEVEQKVRFDVYANFARSMHTLLRSSGLLVMHLGETLSVNMAEGIAPLLEPHFDVNFVGRECVLDTESHGLRDKGATVAHWYLFAIAR